MRQTAGSQYFKIKSKLLQLLRLQSGPTLRLYKGFGNIHECNVYGHALSLAPLPRKKYRNFILYNTAALLRLFIVRPVKGATVELFWGDKRYETTTGDDGFFHFHWKFATPHQPGIYPVMASWLQGTGNNTVIATADAEITIPSPAEFAFISDIDDTFLISHSSNLRKRLFVLLTHNPRSRRPFEGVVSHYQLLQQNHRSFFYVSSSEWNLYDYISEFVRVQQLPGGIFLLNQIKKFSKLFATGQGKHSGKFTRIVRIIEAYPDQKFVLLGDDSQQDPEIYATIVSHFPQNIYCVYIRCVRKKEKLRVRERQRIIENAGVLFCYFNHSEAAIVHSRENGLIK